MLIKELFEPGKDWKWSFQGSEEAVAVFHVGEIPYMFHAYGTDGVWEVEFKRHGSKLDRANKFGLTGTGNSAEVMGTVVDVMRAFLEKYKDKIETLTFSAKEDSRQGLYAKMVKRLLPSWTMSQSGEEFVLAAPNLSEGYGRYYCSTDKKWKTRKGPKQTRKTESIEEARRNPAQNMRSGSGKYDLINFAEDNISDKDNWAVSMTMEPKLGINPRPAVSEDTPKGIYFYPLRYFMQMADRDEALPWGDNFAYLQLFQYDRSGEMTRETQVDPAKLKQALSQYCSEEIIQSAIDDPEYDGTPYWFIYDCLTRLEAYDEKTIIRWNKVLRDLGFTSVYDPGHGWIAYSEPTQGVILDPRIIKQHKMFSNRNPTLQHRRYDIQGLADSIGWSSYYQRESQSQRIYNHPDEKKVMLDVAKSMLKPFLGKSSEEAEEMGYDQALKAAADKVIEILKQSKVGESLEEHIVKVKGGYELRSKHGDKNLGKYPTKAGAEKRERQVQYFKHAGK